MTNTAARKRHKRRGCEASDCIKGNTRLVDSSAEASHASLVLAFRDWYKAPRSEFSTFSPFSSQYLLSIATIKDCLLSQRSRSFSLRTLIRGPAGPSTQTGRTLVTTTDRCSSLTVILHLPLLLPLLDKRAERSLRAATHFRSP
jgi:hypothetical protein